MNPLARVKKKALALLPRSHKSAEADDGTRHKGHAVDTVRVSQTQLLPLSRKKHKDIFFFVKKIFEFFANRCAGLFLPLPGELSP